MPATLTPNRWPTRSSVLVWLVLSLAVLFTSACSRDGQEGCAADVDCKGERICEQGTCVEPHPPASADCSVANGGCSLLANCAVSDGAVHCTCKAGYSGDGRTCIDIDECQEGRDDCDEHAACSNTAGRWACTCLPGWSGDGRTCVDVDECATDHGGCDENADCANSPGSHSCTCRQGFAGDGTACIDVDECLTNRGGCDAHADCVNEPGGYHCTCRTGWTGSGTECSDIDECAAGNGGCDPNATCANTAGGRTCTCRPGWKSNGVTCAPDNPCLMMANGGCDARATCTRTSPTTRTCTCQPGWQGDGTSCADIDECATNNGGCAASATCSNAPGTFACTCPPGTRADGAACHPTWLSLDAAASHTCGVRSDGSLWCWGDDASGQLGDGGLGTTAQPRRIGQGTDWMRVSTGDFSSCALQTSGALACWGSNFSGQLGDGTTQSQFTPQRVGTASWSRVSTGFSHACGIQADGSLWCWGAPGPWLGLGQTTTSPVAPTRVGNATWKEVSAGRNYSCGIRTDGSLWCWGTQNTGQLGDGWNATSAVPVRVGIGSSWASVATNRGVSSHTCAATTAGAVSCWGRNFSGEVGDGTSDDRYTPVEVMWARGSGASVAVGAVFSCAVSGGELFCWGTAVHGALGGAVGSTTGAVRQPMPIAQPSTGWAAVVGGNDHACALRTDGTAWCWGDNQNGKLGLGRLPSTTVPRRIGAATNWRLVETGGDRSCGLRDDGSLYCWGYVATPSGSHSPVPSSVGGLSSKYTTVGIGKSICASDSQGVWCWGDFSSPGTTRVTASAPLISVGGPGGCTVGSNQACWGTAYYGEHNIPYGCSVLSVGGRTSCCVASGTLSCVGYNQNGQVGDGSTANRSSAVAIGPARAWSTVSVGNWHGCAIRQDGTLWCWGDDSKGQLGVSPPNSSLVPVQVGTAAWSFVSVAKDGYSTCGIQQDGTLWCWGSNQRGQLGDGTLLTRNSPEKITADTDWSHVSVANNHTCATKSDGTLWCWGSNDYGQLGDGTAWVSVATRISE